ncbi:hypothetical protein [Bradyrhizobium vignae]|uniref:Uncharacterized protein n=1 Tax=Bradyrhizobium vignae TaxID=1549949 RepID=A0A2U3PUN9_9BRAD|nr:hypothetical protein [Bradyrhizobium vignae]SPP92839.1 protein of unknown function [Bradyrhizobium vignae]
MTDEVRPPAIGAGDFIWSNFPKREAPGVPSNEQHIALCLRRYKHKTDGYILAAVYTTTRPRGDRPKAKGEIEISKEQAAQLGQNSAFRIDVRRIAAMPLNTDFFPYLDEKGHGVRGNSKHLAEAALKLLAEIVKNDPELVEFLGPPEVRKSIFGR